MDDLSLPSSADDSRPVPADQYAAHMALQSGSRTATTLGIISVVYASLGLLTGLCCGLSSAGLGAMVQGAVVQAQTAQQQLKQIYEQQIAEIEQQIAAAENEEDKRELQKSRDELVQQQPAGNAAPPDFDEIADVMASPRLMKFATAEVVSGLLLNLWMLVTGVALSRKRRWGRVWTSYASILKIARLLLLYLPFMFLIWPGWVRELSTAVENVVAQSEANNPAAAKPPAGVPTPQQMGQQVSLSVYVYGVIWAAGMVVLSPIYPGILLWLLRKPNVVVACDSPSQAIV